MEVLLVEDDIYCIDFFKRAFNKKERAVEVKLHHVESVAAARKYLATKDNVKEICLIVLDIKLPLISGFELLQQLKGNEATKTIPVVMFTSSAERQDIDRSYQLGANSYLLKPVDYAEFIATIDRLEEYWLMANHL